MSRLAEKKKKTADAATETPKSEADTIEQTEKPKASTDNTAEELENKYKELEDKYLRLAAEYSNYQKRTQREKEALYAGAVADTLKELLPILDSLERAQAAAQAATDVSAVADGVSMISKMCAEVFTKLGVEKIKAVGEPFDAAVHNAVMHIEDDTFGENEVVEEFQKGYKYKDNIIRYSMVKVAN